MFEAVKVATFVKQHEHEMDKIILSFFDQYNNIGKLDKDEKISNKMQQIFLVSFVRILFTTSGMPKSDQKAVLKGLVDSLGD